MTRLGKRAQQKMDRPLEILAAGLEHFVQNGYTATRLEDIAKTVGVTKGTIYVYFETKEILFSAVVRHFAPNLSDLPPDNPQHSCTDQLVEILSTLHRLIAENRTSREVLHLLIADGRHFPQLLEQYIADFLGPAMARIQAILQLGAERGQIRNTAIIDFPEILTASSVFANVWSVAFGDRRPLDHKRFLRATLDVLLHGTLNPAAQRDNASDDCLSPKSS